MTGDPDRALTEALRELRTAGKRRQRSKQTDAERLEAVRLKVAQARAAGASYERIGDELEVSRQMAQKLDPTRPKRESPAA